jgi:hypothetical protein
MIFYYRKPPRQLLGMVWKDLVNDLNTHLSKSAEVKPKTKGVEEELSFLFYQQQPPDLASGLELS